METNTDHSDGRNPAPTNPAAMEEPRADTDAAVPSPDVPDALPAPDQGTTAGARKRKPPATATAVRKPRKGQVEEPIQMPVHYGHREDFFRVRSENLVEDCSDPSVESNKCAHIIGELPLQPHSMSLVDLQLWIFKLFRLHPETQDLDIKGFLKQHKNDFFDEESSEPECPLDYCPWDAHYFTTDKCWSSFANKLKRKRNVTQRFMLYVQSSEIKHYDILLKVVQDDYSQSVTVVLPGTKCLTSSRLGFCDLARKLTMTAKDIAEYCTGHYGEQISLAEAWRARQFALEREYGTFYDSHNYAPRLLKEIARKNPGCFVDIKDAEVAGCKDFLVLQRMFWAFGQCLQAFRTCRPVLCIKGIPLFGKYKGMLLTAVALDANGFSIPVACSVVEGETKESWLWFLRNLERAVVHQSDVCLIHDYKSELLDAVEDLLNSRQRQWRKAESRWCMEDLAEDFFEYFGDKKLMMMFKKLCQQKRRHKFGKIWKELDELTSKYVVEKEHGASRELQPESVEHGVAELQAASSFNQPVTVEDAKEGDHADDNNRKITNFSDWIHLKPKEKWSLAYDRDGARYGIMGSDIANVYKNDGVLKGIACLPLSAIVEVTFLRLVEYFEKTSAAANKAIGNPSINFPERVQVDMNSKMQKAEMHELMYTYVAEENVLGGEEDRKFTVKGRKRQVTVHLKSEHTFSMNKSEGSTIKKIATCSCNKPQLLHMPCSHVIAVCCEIGVRSAAYMSPYYSLPYLVSTWKQKFNKFSHDYRNTIPRYFRDILPFEHETPTWIPDKRFECALPVCLLSDRIQTAMVEEEPQCRTEDRAVAHNQGTKTYSEERSQV